VKVETVDLDHLSQHLPAVMGFELDEHFLQRDAMEWIFGACGVHDFGINALGVVEPFRNHEHSSMPHAAMPVRPVGPNSFS
jgi:hypothetical protein